MSPVFLPHSIETPVDHVSSKSWSTSTATASAEVEEEDGPDASSKGWLRGTARSGQSSTTSG